MTRINLVPPEELYDQHLFAEWREIKMVPMSLRRSLRARGLKGVLDSIPKQFCLGKGHVSFFYDKGAYLTKRYAALTRELRRRGFSFQYWIQFDPLQVYEYDVASLYGEYEPTEAALILIRERIASKVAMKPQWYRYTRNDS